MKRSEMREQAFLLTFEGLFSSGEDIDEVIELYSENVEAVSKYAKDIFTGVKANKDEFNETMVNLERIKKEALAFVEDYVEHVKGTRVLHKKEFYRRYVFSPLKYFHKELGI